MTPIVCDIQLTADDYLSALRLHRRRVYWFGRFRLLFWAVLLVLLIGLGLMGTGPAAWGTPLFLVLFLASMWLVTDRLILPRQARRIYGQQQSLQRPYHLTISEDGIEVTSSTFTARHGWSAYHRWVEGPDKFLLYQSDVMFVIIPKRFLPRFDDFRQVLNDHVRHAA